LSMSAIQFPGLLLRLVSYVKIHTELVYTYDLIFRCEKTPIIVPMIGVFLLNNRHSPFPRIPKGILSLPMIVLNNLEKQFGSKVLFDAISLSIPLQNRIGLIGPNGAGKSVLIKTIAGKAIPDGGSVSIPSDLKIGYLPQEFQFHTDETPLQIILKPFHHLLNIESTLEKVSSITNTESAEYRAAMKEYEKLQTEMAVHDIHSLEARGKTLFAGLGIGEETWDESITKLSGGFQMRVILAGLLLQEPDFLLFDEPTNHLDYDSLIWLERFLGKYNGGMLVISHDRDFLNRLCTHTAELSHGNLSFYNGNPKAYFAWKEQQDTVEERRRQNLNQKIDSTRAFIERFKAKNTKASQARSRMKQLEKLEEQLTEQGPSIAEIHFQFPEPTRCGTVPIKLEEVAAAYEDLTVFSNISFTVNRGEKIAIIGPNGTGKSTLLKICARELPPQKGTVEIGHNTEIRYFSQHRLDQLDPRKTLYQTIADHIATSNPTAIQSILGAFLFTGEDAEKKVEVLSGGEKSRLSLATILANPGNVLLLDEPTNHLDIQSIEKLAHALDTFAGTILLVSHDEYFLSLFTNRIIEMRPGAFRDFPGTLANYRSYIEQGYLQSIDAVTPGNESTSSSNTSKNDKQERMRIRQEKKQLERAIQKAERAIEDLEQKIAAQEEILHNPANAQNYELLTATTETITTLQNEHEELLEQWEKLDTDLNTVT